MSDDPQANQPAPSRPGGDRAVAIVLHPTRPEALQAAAEFTIGVCARGITVHLLAEPAQRIDELRALLGDRGSVEPLSDQGSPDRSSPDQGSPHCELMIVFGGDGSILGGAEWALPRGVPMLGVNLGHVGFLAELELSDLGDLVDQVVERRYEVESRLSLAVSVSDPDGQPCWTSFAVNEVSVEKAARERMLEVMAIVDERPLSRWGCDGVLVSTPTGSTAYAFSAGGPVLWPDVTALVLVPLSAHALFARPLVLGPGSRVDLDVSRERATPATVWADGRRGVDVAPGSRITVVRGPRDLLIARLSEQPFTTRLVKKFRLPVEGFRQETEAEPPLAEGQDEPC